MATFRVSDLKLEVVGGGFFAASTVLGCSRSDERKYKQPHRKHTNTHIAG